jgi:hypothetical protein
VSGRCGWVVFNIILQLIAPLWLRLLLESIVAAWLMKEEEPGFWR